MGFSIRWLMAVLVISAFAVGCACGQMGQPACPSISVNNSWSGAGPDTLNTLTISGTNFSSIPNCAQLSLDGLPAPQAVIGIGQPPCMAGGVFQNFNWQYSVNCPSPPSLSSSQNVVVVAVDQSTQTSASQTISFPWGPACGLFAPPCIVGAQSSWCGTSVCNDGTCQEGIVTSCANPPQPGCTNGCAQRGGVNTSLGCSQQ